MMPMIRAVLCSLTSGVDMTMVWREARVFFDSGLVGFFSSGLADFLSFGPSPVGAALDRGRFSRLAAEVMNGVLVL